jgi:hypothetical protein
LEVEAPVRVKVEVLLVAFEQSTGVEAASAAYQQLAVEET